MDDINDGKTKLRRIIRYLEKKSRHYAACLEWDHVRDLLTAIDLLKGRYDNFENLWA